MLASGLAEYWPLVEKHGRHGYAVQIFANPDEARENWHPPGAARAGLEYLKGIAPVEPITSRRERLDLVHTFGADEIDRAYREQFEASLLGIPSSRSRLGGLPDVSSGYQWPMRNGDYFDFLGQFYLDELPDGPARGCLPDAGVISFFVHHERREGRSSTEWIGEICVERDVDSLIRVAEHPRSEDWKERSAFYRSASFYEPIKTARQRSLRFHPCFYLPRENDTVCGKQPFWDALGNSKEPHYVKFERLAHRLGYQQAEACNAGVHMTELSRLLGHQYVYQTDQREAHPHIASMDHPVLLFQMMRWGPFSPEIYFFIEQDALMSSDFTDVRVVVDHN